MCVCIIIMVYTCSPHAIVPIIIIIVRFTIIINIIIEIIIINSINDCKHWRRTASKVQTWNWNTATSKTRSFTLYPTANSLPRIAKESQSINTLRSNWTLWICCWW